MKLRKMIIRTVLVLSLLGTNIMMLTLTNGFARSGYIPDDAAFGTYTFEVLSSRLQPGYAESAIVNGILDMMYDSFAHQADE